MPATVSPSFVSRPLLLVALGGLWAYQGTAVFFEMVRDGWIACF